MIPKVEDTPLIPSDYNSLVTQLVFLFNRICYRVNRIPERGIVQVDPSSISADSSADIEVYVPGLKLGDVVLANCLEDLEAGLVYQGARVKTNNYLCIRLYNATNSSINGAAKNWVWVRLD